MTELTNELPERKRPKKKSLTDGQRESFVRRALDGFVRNRDRPEELETLRYNLIVARVLSGMTAVEAAQRFGYKNSTQISLIESGGRPTPRDHQFLRQASQVYAVSCDFLLGLSPHMEFDGRVARQHALVRGTEQILGNIAAQFATVMIKFTEETKPIPDDFESVSTAAENVARTLAVMREKYGLDDMRGSASLVASVEKLARAVEPLRRKIAHYRSIDAYFDELRAGKLPPIPYLTERYSEHQLGLDG
ncbi:MAG: XRE family transcriptional regulator [Paraburkholderia sp.]|nr:MAG: XRE family transcriptional regulator [Paraburkholderia sp.]